MLTGLQRGARYIRRGGQTLPMPAGVPSGGDATSLVSAASSQLPPLELLTSPTPNGHKVSILLEELNVDYRVRCIDLGHGEQFAPEFLAHCPNGKIPAIIDYSPSLESSTAPHSVFETGAILLYLADKFSRFVPPVSEVRARSEVIQWTIWQMANLGPMVGQAITFQRFVPADAGDQAYAKERYGKEARRLYEVLDRQLEGRDYMCGELSIADFATFPWTRAHRMAKVPIDGLSNVEAWLARMKARDGVRAGLSVGFPDTPLGREMGLRYSNDERMTDEQKRDFMAGGSQILHEKADTLTEQQQSKL